MMVYVGLRRGAGVGVAALVLAGGLLSGCSFSVGSGGGKPIVSKADLQKDISERLEKAGQKPQSVNCKDDLEGEVGKSTRCEVALTDTNAFEPIVTVTKVDGTTVSYDMTPAVSKEQLEKSVATLVQDNSGIKADSVQCESGLEGKKGSEAHCNVTVNGQTEARTVDVTKVDGLLMNFNLIPILPQADLENSLLEQLTPQVGRRPDSATCAGNLDGKPGNTVDCTVVAGDETQDFTLTVTSVEGNQINFKYAPKS
jgi:hypothetical protein